MITDMMLYFIFGWMGTIAVTLIAVHGGGVTFQLLALVPFFTGIAWVFWYTRIRK
ncbi:MAG: hypothetical protein E7I22_05115 [Bifidobacterium longum]|jgi:Flp pilus assembly protein TadB|nr:hypothetical protein [Bifidobacterium longum]